MKVLPDWNLLGRRRRPVALAVGFFDGLHRGHRRVIEEARRAARAMRGEAWVLTFANHPLSVLRPEAAPRLLTAARHKVALIARLGADGCLLMPFTRRFAALRPEEFAARLIDAVRPLRAIVTGAGWRFGRDGAGTAARLADLAGAHGIAVKGVRPVMRRRLPISSTRIRTEVAAGRLDEAAAMLGRPFSILGTVTRGTALGRRLGFPTANLDPHNEVLPPGGVYAVFARRQRPPGRGRRRAEPLRAGVLNLGLAPTVGLASAPRIELHLLDFKGDLYGADIEVWFVRRLRDEARFSSAADLRAAIARDAAAARRTLARKKDKESLYSPAAEAL
ncbi:MAG: riboflavin biosynthesis protein RibF [Lentisphaerae bacterium]|nr:riboflavin biosynthesis protein RibF [Lentisphaerota bacterium]